MDSRKKLHESLKVIENVKKVYFNPPSNVKMIYPCIRYELNRIDPTYADNQPYVTSESYLVTIIDKDPLSKIYKEVCKIPSAKFSNAYIADGLNHWVFIIH